MKRFVIFLVLLVLSGVNSLWAQPIRCGVMSCIEDSLQHHYIGLTIFQLFQKTYPATFNPDTLIMRKTLEQLKQQYPEVEFVEIEEKHYRELLNRYKNSNESYKKQRQLWFQTLKQEYNIESLLLITNEMYMGDVVGNSKWPIYGYGIYNGVYPRNSAVYIQLKRHFFYDRKESRYVARSNIFIRDSSLPRLTNKSENFNNEQLMSLEDELVVLLEKQFKEIMEEPWILRRMAQAFNKVQQ